MQHERRCKADAKKHHHPVPPPPPLRSSPEAAPAGKWVTRWSLNTQPAASDCSYGSFHVRLTYGSASPLEPRHGQRDLAEVIKLGGEPPGFPGGPTVVT